MLCILINLYMYIITYNMIATHNKTVNHGVQTHTANRERGLAQHEVPAFRLGRLAVDVYAQGQGMAGQLLLAAGRRCLRVATEPGQRTMR